MLAKNKNKKNARIREQEQMEQKNLVLVLGEIRTQHTHKLQWRCLSTTRAPSLFITFSPISNTRNTLMIFHFACLPYLVHFFLLDFLLCICDCLEDLFDGFVAQKYQRRQKGSQVNGDVFLIWLLQIEWNMESIRPARSIMV